MGRARNIAWVAAMLAPALVALGAGCSVERDRSSITELDFVDGDCPSATEARPLIVESEAVPTRIDGRSCATTSDDDVGAIEESPSVSVASCCLAVVCSGALDVHARRALYDATCRQRGGRSSANTCENLSSWTRLDPGEAQRALEKRVPACTVAPDAAVRTATTLICSYTTQVHLRCDNSPG